jgi:hypothetical protein
MGSDGGEYLQEFLWVFVLKTQAIWIKGQLKHFG